MDDLRDKLMDIILDIVYEWENSWKFDLGRFADQILELPEISEALRTYRLLSESDTPINARWTN